MRILRNLVAILALMSVPLIGLAAPLNINSADAAALASTIKGVGMKKAQAIVSYRKQHGKFHSIDELSNVKGIGPKTVAANKDILTVKDEK